MCVAGKLPAAAAATLLAFSGVVSVSISVSISVSVSVGVGVGETDVRKYSIYELRWKREHTQSH